jgi:DNA polymerase III subunit epsilon
MFSFLRSKKYPEFWNNYLDKFDKKTKRFVAINVETSGLDPNEDVILSIGTIGIENDAIIIQDCYEVAILQYIYNQTHNRSNTNFIESKQPKSSEPLAIEAFINYLGNAILIGHRIDFDVEMINRALEKLECGKLKNEALDIEVMFKKWKEFTDEKTFTIEEMNNELKINNKNEIVQSTDNAFSIALLFLKLKSRLKSGN